MTLGLENIPKVSTDHPVPTGVKRCETILRLRATPAHNIPMCTTQAQHARTLCLRLQVRQAKELTANCYETKLYIVEEGVQLSAYEQRNGRIVVTK